MSVTSTSSPSAMLSAERTDFFTGRTKPPSFESVKTDVDQVVAPTATRTPPGTDSPCGARDFGDLVGEHPWASRLAHSTPTTGRQTGSESSDATQRPQPEHRISRPNA